MSNSLYNIENYELNTNLNKAFVDSVRTNAESTFPKQTKIQTSQRGTMMKNFNHCSVENRN